MKNRRDKQRKKHQESQTEYSDYFILCSFVGRFWLWLFCCVCIYVVVQLRRAQLYDYLSVLGWRRELFDVCRSLNRCGHRILMCARTSYADAFIHLSITIWNALYHCYWFGCILLFFFGAFRVCALTCVCFAIEFTGNELQTFALVIIAIETATSNSISGDNLYWPFYIPNYYGPKSDFVHFQFHITSK